MSRGGGSADSAFPIYRGQMDLRLPRLHFSRRLRKREREREREKEKEKEKEKLKLKEKEKEKERETEKGRETERERDRGRPGLPGASPNWQNNTQ
jgi:hypothetical protein